MLPSWSARLQKKKNTLASSITAARLTTHAPKYAYYNGYMQYTTMYIHSHTSDIILIFYCTVAISDVGHCKSEGNEHIT